MLTQEDLQNIKDLFEDQNHHIDRLEQKIDSGFWGLDNRMDGIEHRMDGIEHRMDGIEQRMDGMEHRMGGMEHRMDGMEQRQNNMENYMHDKFAVIENDLIPKVNTLYETTDLYVKRIEYRKQIAEIENKLDYVDPLVEIVQFHGEKLEQHETIIKKLVETV